MIKFINKISILYKFVQISDKRIKKYVEEALLYFYKTKFCVS